MNNSILLPSDVKAEDHQQQDHLRRENSPGLTPVCRDYLRGTCLRGGRCRYYHPQEKDKSKYNMDGSLKNLNQESAVLELLSHANRTLPANEAGQVSNAAAQGEMVNGEGRKMDVLVSNTTFLPSTSTASANGGSAGQLPSSASSSSVASSNRNRGTISGNNRDSEEEMNQQQIQPETDNSMKIDGADEHYLGTTTMIGTASCSSSTSAAGRNINRRPLRRLSSALKNLNDDGATASGRGPRDKNNTSDVDHEDSSSPMVVCEGDDDEDHLGTTSSGRKDQNQDENGQQEEPPALLTNELSTSTSDGNKPSALVEQQQEDLTRTTAASGASVLPGTRPPALTTLASVASASAAAGGSTAGAAAEGGQKPKHGGIYNNVGFGTAGSGSFRYGQGSTSAGTSNNLFHG
ncbi:unnamed protein product, partial [Amoebophrya sp. A120]|eukprot:GSA120T00025879001.1